MRRTKIVATVGPTSDQEPVLEAMANAGMDVARVPLAHGTPEEAMTRVRRIRSVVPGACILVDLAGPKIRTAGFACGGVRLEPGRPVVLAPARDGVPSTEHEIGVGHPDLVAGLEPGDTVILGDGTVLLAVDRRVDGGVVATVVTGDWVRGRPGVTAPARTSGVVTPTREDLEQLEALVRFGIDAVAVSFVRSADDLRDVRIALGSDCPMLVAKIETAEAVDDLDAIVEATDAAMIARGDLGVRLALEEVPHIQARIIRAAAALGRPVITATQMLESMISAANPTRAEVADVANAVLQGTSALMLSAETAVGIDPPRVVRTMARIAERSESAFDHIAWGAALRPRRGRTNVTHACRLAAATASASWRIAMDGEVACIVDCTRSGRTSRAISRYRPMIPVVAWVPCARVARQLSLTWGVHPFETGGATADDTELVEQAIRAVVDAHLAAKGDLIVVLTGSTPGEEQSADTIRLIKVD